jgi:regulator of sigma E protease
MPIPVLDGGHIVFATIAKLRSNALPINLIVRIQTVFVVLLFSMIIYVGVFDSLRWKGDHDEEHRLEVMRGLYFDPAIDATGATPPQPGKSSQ